MPPWKAYAVSHHEHRSGHPVIRTNVHGTPAHVDSPWIEWNISEIRRNLTFIWVKLRNEPEGTQRRPTRKRFPSQHPIMVSSAHTNGAGASSSHVGEYAPTPAPFRRLYQLLLPEREDLATIALFAVFSGILYLATPIAVDILVNNLAFGASEGVYIQALVILSLGLFGFLILLGLVRAAQYYVTELIQRRLFVRLTADMVYRLPRVEMAALDRKAGPDLVNRFFDMITVQKAASMLLLDGLNLVLGASVGLLILGFYHPFLLVFDLLLIISLVVVLYGFGVGAVRTSIRESYAKHDVAAWLEQVALFPYLFKSDGGARIASRRADALAEEYLEARGTHYRIVFRQIVGLLGLQAIASASLLGVGGFLVLEGQLTLGQLVAAELIVSTILANLASLGKYAETFYDALAAVDKIGYVVDLPIQRSDGEDVAPDAPAGMRIDVDGLAFGYHPERPILKDLTLHVEPGERVAVVGSAGDGTSTLFDILYGVRSAQGGIVRVDQVDIRNWDLERYRQTVALVRGHDIVEGSILENVRFGREGLTRSQVETALESVGLLNAVLRLPEGLETKLRMGGRPLSSSQRSRLVVARAIVCAPRLLLIDEALENLEPRTLKDLMNTVFDPAAPWTLLVASHDDDVLNTCARRVNIAEFAAGQPGVAV